MTTARALFVLAVSLALGGCKDILDLKDLEAVDGRDVWKDPALAQAYVNRIYADNLPQFAGGDAIDWSAADANNSDESPGGNAFMYGQLTENSVNYWPYAPIRRINILLTQIDQGTIDTLITKRLKGEAYFFRAWRYWEMVKRYGGVPLILTPQAPTDSLLVARDSTSKVVRQVVSDLDSAVALLPATQATSADNNGRLHKGAAMALKGRVLLYYASPQFNRTNDIGRWQNAYDANLVARDYLASHGFGLYPDFAGLWFVDMNKEAIFVRRYSYPVSTHRWAAATRPLDVSQGATGANRPTLELVNAFPMWDGRPIAGNPAYDTLSFWKNRDPRFYATIAYNGAVWELNGQVGRRQWTYVGSESNNPTPSGLYARKAVNPEDDAFEAFNGQTQWIEMRYAEVLMNVAEAANAIGNTQVAYDQIIALRVRARIDPGAGLYGLDAGMTGAQMQNAIMLERQIEFAYEAKRHWDLRRNMLFESLLNGTRRHGLKITLLVPAATWNQVRDTVDLDATYGQYFAHQVISLDPQFTIAWKSNYYFYAIPSSHLQLNSNLKQTIGWAGGTFDPLP
jgi:hypothetical protein